MIYDLFHERDDGKRIKNIGTLRVSEVKACRLRDNGNRWYKTQPRPIHVAGSCPNSDVQEYIRQDLSHR